MAGSGTVQVYHTDGLGSVRVLTDGNGNVIQTYQSDEFGIPTQTQGGVSQPFQFTGQQHDASTGLYDLRARMYDQTIGRFLSRDPLFGLLTGPISLNRYSYVLNSPVRLVDPSGFSTSNALNGESPNLNCYDPTANRQLHCINFPPIIGPNGSIFLGAASNKILDPGGDSDEDTQLHITFGHGARHLEGTGLNAEEVESAIAQTIRDSTKDATAVGPFWGRVTVEGQIIEFRAFPIDETHINVGTYYPVP